MAGKKGVDFKEEKKNNKELKLFFSKFVIIYTCLIASSDYIAIALHVCSPLLSNKKYFITPSHWLL